MRYEQLNETICELWCRIGILEKKVDDLMKFAEEISYFIRPETIDMKEGEQS